MIDVLEAFRLMSPTMGYCDIVSGIGDRPHRDRPHELRSADERHPHHPDRPTPLPLLRDTRQGRPSEPGRMCLERNSRTDGPITFDGVAGPSVAR
jgi:hypothetical protein